MPLKGCSIWGEMKLFPFPCSKIQAQLCPEKSLAFPCIPTFSLISQHLPSCSQVKAKPEQTFGNFNPWPIFPHLFSVFLTQHSSWIWAVTRAPVPSPASWSRAGQDSLSCARPVTGTAGSHCRQPKPAQTPQEHEAKSQRMGPELIWGGLSQDCASHVGTSMKILWRHRAVTWHTAPPLLIHLTQFPFVSMEKDWSPSYSRLIFTHQPPSSLGAVSCVGCPSKQLRLKLFQMSQRKQEFPEQTPSSSHSPNIQQGTRTMCHPPHWMSQTRNTIAAGTLRAQGRTCRSTTRALSWAWPGHHRWPTEPTQNPTPGKAAPAPAPAGCARSARTWYPGVMEHSGDFCAVHRQKCAN